jgi:hypothetical protein
MQREFVVELYAGVLKADHIFITEDIWGCNEINRLPLKLEVQLRINSVVNIPG